MKAYRFVHLNVHSHYSINDGCASIRELVDAAIKDKMPGVAITDNGNMFGVMEFFDYVSRINNERRQKGKKPFKPIIGCELYVAPGVKEDKKLCKHCKGYRLTVLAKNYQGYKNLIKIVSNSWTDGYYMRPRTDHHDLEKYHDGLLVLSGGVGSEVYSHVVSDDIAGLDVTIKWYKQIFGEDYYLELHRCADYDLKSNTPSNLMLEQQRVNAVLMQKAKEYGVKVVATNDVHYVAPEDLTVYNIQQCYATGKTMEEYTAQMPFESRWLRNRKEMCELFSDVPEAIASTMEIYNKVEFFDIRHAPIVPAIYIPDGFGNERISEEDAYLEYLSFSKAKQIYGKSLSEDVADRLKFELEIIRQRGASGYFLFLQEVINLVQSELEVWVGPGRGSAAGSLVCYCLGITKIDPLKHDLLFERFLIPGGTTFPDIDIDVDDERREDVLELLQQIYGKECCAHIVSFSTYSDDSVLKRKVRGLDVHACGFVVANEPISNWAPIATVGIEDSNGNDKILRCVQYDGRHVEKSGLIKFDFIGVKAISQMREICDLIKSRKNANFNIEKIPIDDEKTMKLFQAGQTDDVFQFDSQGMQKYLRDLHPSCFEDLVILNCMYRPGIMEYIPTFIKHKKSKKGIKYIIPCMEKYVYNKSHVVCYTWLAYQMAYLKAHYPEEFKQVIEKYSLD